MVSIRSLTLWPPASRHRRAAPAVRRWPGLRAADRSAGRRRRPVGPGDRLSSASCPTPTAITIPAHLLPGGRPLRLRPVARSAPRRSTRSPAVGRDAAGHVPPAGAGARARRPRARRARRAVRAARRLRGRARQRRLDRVLGRRDALPRRATARSSARSGSSAPSSPPRRPARPFLGEPAVHHRARPAASRCPASRTASTPTPGRTTRRRPGVVAPVRRVAGLARAGRARARRRARRARAASRSTSRRPTSTTSRRRSRFASDGGLWLAAALPRGDRARRADRVERPVDPRVPVVHHGADELAPGPDAQHPGRRDARAARRAARLDARQRRPARGPRSAPPTSAGHLYGWAESRDWATPFVADPAPRSHVVGTIDLDAGDRGADGRARAARATASSTSSPTASWAATSCGSRCSRRSTRTTCSRSPRASTTWSSSSL